MNQKQTRSRSRLIVGILWLSLILVDSPAQVMAAFVIEFDPMDLRATSNGSDQSVLVDVLVTHDGIGPSTLSSFTIDVERPETGLVISGPVTSPIEWSFGAPSLTVRSGGAISIGAASLANTTVPVGGSATLATVNFQLSGDVVAKSFPLNLSVRDANRNAFEDIKGEVVTRNSFFVVAVPEPQCVPMLAMIAASTLARFRRRRK